MILKAKKDYLIATYNGVKIRNNEVEYEGNDYGRDYRTHRPIDKNVSKDIAEKILKFLKTGQSITKPTIFETVDSIAQKAHCLKISGLKQGKKNLVALHTRA